MFLSVNCLYPVYLHRSLHPFQQSDVFALVEIMDYNGIDRRLMKDFFHSMEEAYDFI